MPFFSFRCKIDTGRVHAIYNEAAQELRRYRSRSPPRREPQDRVAMAREAKEQ